MGLTGLEFLHLAYALAGCGVLTACLYIICSRRKRRDRTFNSLVLTLVSVCLIFENVVIAFGGTIGQGTTLDRLSRARLIIHSLVAPGFIVVLSRLAARFRINWPWPGDVPTPEQIVFRGRVWTGVAVVLASGLIAFCIARDADEVLEPSNLAGTTSYAHEHVNWGISWDDAQEWIPTAVLLIWSCPIAYLIHQKGGLKWYHNKLYFLPLVVEVLLFVTRCMPEEYSAHVSNGAELLLLITFIFIEDKLSGEIQDIRLLEKMIKNRQELSGITAKLNARYGTSVEEDGAVSHMDWEIQRRTSGTGVKNRSITRKGSSTLNEMGIISPSQMLGLDARLHDPTGPDHSAHPVSSVNLRASASLTRSTESLHASSNDSTNTGDAVLRKIVQEKNLAAEQASTPHGAEGAKLMVQSRPKTTEVQSAGPKKRPGHARKHSM